MSFRNVSWIEGMIDAGWGFRWEPDTRFIGAYHPDGGKQSVLEVVKLTRTDEEVDEIGQALADLFNESRGRNENP